MLKDIKKIEDQYTDRSGSVLVKIASKLENLDDAKSVVDMLYGMEGRLDKLASKASFNCDTLEDTVLSRVYFEGQKHLMKEAEAKAIDDRIAVREALYGIQAPAFAPEAPVEKKASVELLPGVSVSTPEELEKIGADFEANYRQLSYDDRKSFANAFAKVATNIPASVKLYACQDVCLRPDAAEQLHFRKVACDHAGKDGSAYMKLAELLADYDSASATKEELAKLAETVHTLDKQFGLDGVAYDKRLPDAWHAMLKVAANNDSSLSADPKPPLDRSDIIARYGEAALDEVENPDGTINQARLKEIMSLFGEDDPSEKKPLKDTHEADE